MDDLDLRRINHFIDEKYRYNNVPPRFHQKPFTAEKAAEIEQKAEDEREKAMKYYSHITSVFSEANTSMRQQSMLESNASILGTSVLNDTIMTDRSSSSAVFNRSLSLKLAKGQKKQDGT